MKLEQVTVRAGRKVLVEGASLEVAPGRICALIGPNGAGKSTLLRVAAGELKPSEGVASFRGLPVFGTPARTMAQVRAVLPQHASLSFPFRVAEVVTLGRRPFHEGAIPARDLAIVKEVVAALGLEPLLQRNYASLSGGERQRVHAARVLSQVWDATPEEPRWLLLDEPTAAFDLPRVAELFALLCRRVADASLGVLVVVHDLTLAGTFADDVAIMQRGRLVHAGPAEQLLTPEILEPIFETPLMTVTLDSGRRVVVPAWSTVSRPT